MTTRVADVPDLVQLWQYKNLLLGGQPGDRAWDGIKAKNIVAVINLRAPSEADFAKDKLRAEGIGIQYHQIPLLLDGKISKEAAKEISEIVSAHGSEEKILVHCGSANRVAGWLIVHLAKAGMDFNEAVEIAKQSGLSNPAFIEQAEMIIKG